MPRTKFFLVCFLLLSGFQLESRSGYGDLTQRIIDKAFFVGAFAGYEPAAFAELKALSFSNLSLVEEVVLIKLDEGGRNNFSGRWIGLLMLVMASRENRIPATKFFDIIFKLVSQNEIYVPASTKEMEFSHFASLVKNYSSGLPINEHFQNALSILDTMFNNKLITNSGILNSLKKKIENSQKDIKNNNKTSALNLLNAAINEINAQNGKHITKEGVSILIGYINNLLSQLNQS